MKNKIVKIQKRNIPVILLVTFGTLFLLAGLVNHYFFRSFTFDYGNYNFAFWDYSHLRISSIPTYPGNFLQDHFSFTLFYFIPIYWLLNWLTGTYTLIIIQYALIAIAAWYSYKLIELYTRNIWLGIGIIVYYFVLLGRFTTLSSDVNLAILSSCFIPIFLYYFETKKYAVAFLLFLLSLLSRENIPLWFIFIFIVLIIQHRKEKKVIFFSLGGIIISLLYFILLFKIFIPSIETDEKQFTLFNYSALGANPGEAFLFVLKHPIETVSLFFVNHLDNQAYNGIKIEFYMVYLISGGVILFRRPQYFIWFIPIVAQKVLNDAPLRWGIATYYSIEVITLLPLSVFLTLSSLKSKTTQNLLAILVVISTVGMTIFKLNPANTEVPEAFNPDKENFFSKEFYESPYQLKETHKLLSQIPTDAVVSASSHLLPHLAQRKSIYLFPEVNDAEYIVFSVFDNYFMSSHMQNEKTRNNYFSDENWEVTNEEFPVFLLQKRPDQTATYVSSYFDNFVTDTLFCDFEKTDTTSEFVVFNSGKIADSSKSTTSETSLSDSTSLLLNRQNPYGRAIEFKESDSIKYIEVTAWMKGDESKAFIVAKHTELFNLNSNLVVEKDSSGWKKLEISCWVPPVTDNSKFFIHLWNAGDMPVFFDNMEVIIFK